jgi:hypothetical protein
MLETVCITFCSAARWPPAAAASASRLGGSAELADKRASGAGDLMAAALRSLTECLIAYPKWLCTHAKSSAKQHLREGENEQGSAKGACPL